MPEIHYYIAKCMGWPMFKRHGQKKPNYPSGECDEAIEYTVMGIAWCTCKIQRKEKEIMEVRRRKNIPFSEERKLVKTQTRNIYSNVVQKS